MTARKYYAERKGLSTPESMDFEMLKKAFLYKFEQLESELCFQEATGYECVTSGFVRGIWGSDVKTFFFLKLRMHDIWPIPEKTVDYDESTLFTVIEFLYDYVSEPEYKWYHDWDDCGWHSGNYNRDKGRERYRKEMNDILKDYDSGYKLSNTGEILNFSPTGLEALSEEVVETDDPENIDKRIHAAIIRYTKYKATSDDKKDAIRVLADVLEYLRSQNIRLPARDDSDLFRIINNFDIRHHNRMQQGDYNRDIWYDWMFYTFLSSIYVLLKLR